MFPSSSSTSSSYNYCNHCLLTIPLESWLTHLASEMHQMTLRQGLIVNEGEDKGDRKCPTLNWDYDRILRIYNCIGVTSIEILKYLQKFWGNVDDFKCNGPDGAASSIFVLMQDSKCVENVTNYAKIHQVSEGKTIGIKTMSLAAFQKEKIRKSRIKKNKNARANPSSSQLIPTISNKVYQSPDQMSSARTKFSCSTCSIDAFSLNEWLIHLTSLTHKKINTLGLKSWDCKNGVNLNGTSGILKMDILEFLSKWGNLVDFLDNPNNCQALFNLRESADKLLSFKDYILISGIKVEVRPIPEFAGHTKKDRQLMRAQKLTTELLDITSGNDSSKLNKFEKNKEEKNTAFTILDKVKGFPEQIDAILSHAIWSDDFLRMCEQVIEKELPTVLRYCRDSELSKVKILPISEIITKVGLNMSKRAKVILDFEDTAYYKDILDFQTQEKIVHSLRLAFISYQMCRPSISKTNFENLSATPLPLTHHWEHCNCPTNSNKTVPEFCFRVQDAEFCLSFSQSPPLEFYASKLIAFYSKLDTRITPLLGILTYLKNVWNLSFPELFPNHFISILLIFFLQHRKLIPTVQELWEKENNARKFCKTDKMFIVHAKGFDFSFCSDINLIKPNEIGLLKDKEIKALSIISLLKEFYIFFESLETENYVVCPRLGILVKKEYFLPGNENQLPPELIGCKLNVNGRFVVQDPFILSLNLSKNIGQHKMYRFIGHCRNGSHLLTKAIEEGESNLQLLFKKQNKKREHPDANNSEETFKKSKIEIVNNS